MKKLICAVFALVFLAACTPTKPAFCYELSAQEQQPGKKLHSLWRGRRWLSKEKALD